MGAEVVLTAPEKVTLVDCEAVIERGVRTFVEVGTALSQIRDGRLYRESHGTFEGYCKDRWGFDRSRADQLVKAAELTTTVVNAGLPAPANEGQARELAKAPQEQRAEIWRETVERTDGKPTAAAVREVRNELIPIQPDIAQPIDEWLSPPPPRPAWTDELQRDSERRAAAAGLRSVLTYLTSTVLKPADLAGEYAEVIDQFPQPDLDYAAETMRAIADLKHQGATDG